jgi:Uma2 family endonuclease
MGQDYRRTLPGPDDVLLLIEVADSSVGYDREVKLPLYAASRIPEVWIVDLDAGRVETYRSPQGDGYVIQSTAGARQLLTPAAFPDVTLRVEDILGA